MTGDSSSSPTSEEETRPVLAGRYRLVSQIGQGSASTLYLGHDVRLGGRPVAVKVANVTQDSNETAANREHLINEARALTIVRHPAVIQLTDVLIQGSHCSLILEYLPGRTLHDMVDGAPAGELDVLEWGVRLCDALAYLHARQPPMVHGSLHAGHCMLLPTGRLVLFDFGSALPGNAAALRQDVRKLVILLYRLLAGLDTQAPSDGIFPPVRAYVHQVSIPTDKLMTTVLNGPESTSFTLAMLRQQLRQCSEMLGALWSMCPYCQATIRVRTDYCNACGSTLEPDIVHPTTSAAQTRPLNPASPPALPATRILGLPPGATDQPKRSPTLYTQKLRAIGYYIERQGLRRVTIVDGTTGIFIRGQTDGIGRLNAVSPGTTVTAIVSDEELAELNKQAQQQRNPGEQRGPTRKIPGLLGSSLFPRGYEDRLRAVGAELDGLPAVSLLTIVESSSELYLDYHLVDAESSAGIIHRHDVLSATDLETILNAMIARRYKGQGGHSLRAMIERGQQRK